MSTAAAAAPPAAEGAADRPARAPFAAADWVVVAAFAALAVAPLAALLVRVWTKGGLVTGGDGFLVEDPLQYLNWARQAGSHVLVGNLYDLAPGDRTFLHPLILLSGLLHRLGVGIAAAYLLWTPVAVGLLLLGTFRYAGRFLGRPGDRRLAVVLALFFATPVSAFVGWTGLGGQSVKFDLDFAGGELWAGTYVWGYLFTAIAVGLMPLVLLAYERGRGGAVHGLLAAALGGLLVAWLQPWQGATLAVILLAGEAVLALRARGGVGEAVRRLVPVLAAIALPLVYYYVLSKRDPSWELAGQANALGRWPLWVTVAALAPLAVPAAFAYRGRAASFGEIALRAWPFAGLLIFYQPAGTFPFHAFQGLALPLAVLAVLAVRGWLGARPLPVVPVVLVCALFVVPGTLYRADELRGAVQAGHQPFFLEPGEHDALRAMAASPLPGGILTPVYSGLLVPAYTGRETWVGARSWTPHFAQRQNEAEALFSGRMGAAQARALVRSAGPRFVYADCQDRIDLTRLLGPLLTGPPAVYGCARVWRVRPQYVKPVG